MNIILFHKDELQNGLPDTDFRVQHLLHILKLDINDEFSSGIINDELGISRLKKIKDKIYFFDFEPTHKPPTQAPIKLICGLPRPPVARRILKDTVTAGIKQIHFVTVENSEKSYAQSKLWKTNDHQIAMLEGAQQGKTTLLPQLFFWDSVAHLLKKSPLDGDKIFLDNCNNALSFSDHLIKEKQNKETVIAVGSERGWTTKERILFTENGYQPLSLGPRIFRTETAVTAALLLTENIKEI